LKEQCCPEGCHSFWWVFQAINENRFEWRKYNIQFYTASYEIFCHFHLNSDRDPNPDPDLEWLHYIHIHNTLLVNKKLYLIFFLSWSSERTARITDSSLSKWLQIKMEKIVKKIAWISQDYLISVYRLTGLTFTTGSVLGRVFNYKKTKTCWIPRQLFSVLRTHPCLQCAHQTQEGGVLNTVY